MSVRSTQSLVTFRNSFSLSALEAALPPGTYRVVVDEEEIPELSFVAYRRVATMLHIPSVEVSTLTARVIKIDPEQLAVAIAIDAGSQPETENTQGASL
jgi:hypothetical protein